MTRHSFWGFLALTFLTCAAFAADTPAQTPTVDGVSAWVVGDTVNLPLRAVADWLSCTESVDAKTNAVTVTLPDFTKHTTPPALLKTLVFTPGASTATVDGATVDLGGTVSQPQDMTYVPATGILAAFNAGKSLGISGAWDAKARQYTLSKDGATPHDLVFDDMAACPVVRITTAKGDIVMRLFPGDAPLTVANFVSLVQAGFYNGLMFHRVETATGFQLIQGGDQKGDGSGGGPKTVKREISAKLTHVEGAVGLARSQDPDSGSCQFYICNCPIHALDGGYCVFGLVIEGLDVSKQIVKGDKMLKVTVTGGVGG